MNDDYFAYKNTSGGSGGSGGSSGGGGFISWQTVLIIIAICIFFALIGRA